MKTLKYELYAIQLRFPLNPTGHSILIIITISYISKLFVLRTPSYLLQVDQMICTL
jgi:hypothetical protein